MRLVYSLEERFFFVKLTGLRRFEAASLACCAQYPLLNKEAVTQLITNTGIYICVCECISVCMCIHTYIWLGVFFFFKYISECFQKMSVEYWLYFNLSLAIPAAYESSQARDQTLTTQKWQQWNLNLLCHKGTPCILVFWSL